MAETTLAELAGASAHGPDSEPRRSLEISLDLPAAETDESIQLAANWEFLSPAGSTQPNWDERAIDLGPTEVSSADAASFGPDPAPKWESAIWVPPAAPAAPGPELAEALEAFGRASSEGELGQALLAFCASRFPRAFLFAERFGLAMVGPAAGPGSDTPAVFALRVDLEAPSCFAAASLGRTPVETLLPDGPVDAALFAALAAGELHLVVTALRLRELPVGFLVITADRSLSPAELDEVAQAAAGAEATFARLRS